MLLFLELILIFAAFTLKLHSYCFGSFIHTVVNCKDQVCNSYETFWYRTNPIVSK